MKTETVLDMLGLGLRAAEAALQRRRPATAGPDTRADRIVRRVVLPMAEKALGRVAPASARPSARPRRRGLLLGLLASSVAGALAAGAAAYVVVKQQQRVRERYKPLHAPFPPGLLEVLAAPGGAGRLEAGSDTLTDRQSGAVYAIIDGIPDFIAPAAPSEPLAAEFTWMQDLVRPVVLLALGRNSAGNAALAADLMA